MEHVVTVNSTFDNFFEHFIYYFNFIISCDEWSSRELFVNYGHNFLLVDI